MFVGKMFRCDVHCFFQVFPFLYFLLGPSSYKKKKNAFLCFVFHIHMYISILQFSRNLFLDQASSVVYIEGFPAYTSQGYLVAQLSLLGRIDDVAMAPPYYDEGMMKGSAYVYYDDYDSVDKALRE